MPEEEGLSRGGVVSWSLGRDAPESENECDDKIDHSTVTRVLVVLTSCGFLANWFRDDKGENWGGLVGGESTRRF